MQYFLLFYYLYCSATLMILWKFRSDIEKHWVIEKNWDIELLVTSYKLRVTDYWLRVESLKARVEIQKFEFNYASYKVTSTSLNSRVASSTLRAISLVTFSNPRLQGSFNQVNKLKTYSFSEILSSKSFGNL